MASPAIILDHFRVILSYFGEKDVAYPYAIFKKPTGTFSVTFAKILLTRIFWILPALRKSLLITDKITEVARVAFHSHRVGRKSQWAPGSLMNVKWQFLLVCLIGFLASSSAARLSRSRTGPKIEV